MRLLDILNRIDPIEISEDIDVEKDVEISVNSPCECSLLFVTRRVKGGYSEVVAGNRPYAIVCEKEYAKSVSEVPTITVRNARRALALAYSAKHRIDYNEFSVIGVTGTNGKTTTATLIHHILSEGGVKCGFIGTGVVRIGCQDATPDDYTMTTPDPSVLYPLLYKMQSEGCKAVVMEVSSHAIALEKVAGIEFALAVFTNLTPEHMDFHTSIEEYFDTKLKLLRASHRCIVNIDDRYGIEAKKRLGAKAQTVGIVRGGDASATEISSHGMEGSEFYYRTDELIFHVCTDLPGAFNIYNVMLALSAAIDYGIKPCIAKKAIKSGVFVRGRMEKIHNEPSVIIDYAHTPFAFDNALKTLKNGKKARQRLIVVFGCGGERDKFKRAQMGLVASKYADYIILTEDNSRSEPTSEIINQILDGISVGVEHEVIEDRKEAIVHALGLANHNDIVAIIGKGHERYKIDSSGLHYFDEREIVEDYFGAKK